jgi:nitrogen regulatory protein PII
MDYKNMSQTRIHTGYSLITVVLPKESAKRILEKALSVKISTQIIFNARGTLFREKWYQKIKPAINPEQTIFELLVPADLVPVIMDRISIAAGLHEGKRGAVYCVPCSHAAFMQPDMFPDTYNIQEIEGAEITYNNQLTAIYCHIRKGMAEAVATAAIRAGSSEPTILYGQGQGFRDKLGLLRIAISPEKELIRVLVNDYDVEPVFEAMVKQGKLDTPGRGYIYLLPVEKGIINMAAVTSDRKELASRQQVIKAIDEIKGSSAWRIQNETEQSNKRKFLTDLYRLNCVVEKGKADNLIKSAIQAGAPGATITNGLAGGGVIHKQGSSVSVYREMDNIEFTMLADKFEPVLSAMIQSAKDDGNNEAYFYSHLLPKALTYTGG